MKKWEDEQQGEKSKKSLLMMGWLKEHKLATAGIVLALVLLSGIGAYGAVSLYQKNAGKNAAGDSSGAIGTLQNMQEEEAQIPSKEPSVNESGKTEVQESEQNGKNEEADASDSENTASGSNKKRKGSENAPTSTPTPTASPTATPKPTPKPTAVPETSGDSGSGGEQEIMVSRGEEKGPNGYSFPVYSEITPIDLSDFICVDEATGEKMTLPTDGTAAKKKHTMLIYLCGSDLISQIPKDLSGLISSNFDSDDVNVLVLLGGNAEWKGSEPEYLKNSCEHGNAVIYEVHPQATTFSSREASDLLNEDTLKKVADLSNLPLGVNGKNMGNPALLAGFMDFAYDHYKAEEYSIILWNHGSGVAGVCYDENVRTDNNKNDLLELPELGSAFNSSKLRKDGKKWSFIGMDACLMSSIEVMAVLAQYGNYYISSEETERGGWDYREFPKLLQGNDIEKIGKKIVDDFCEYKSELDQVQTMSLVNLNKILELGDEFEAWAGDMMTYANTDSDWYSKFFAARDEVMEFGWNEDLTTFCQIDLIHFLDLLKQKGISSEHMTNLRNLLSVDGTGAIVYQKSTQETERIHGVTIYFENAKELNEAKYEAYYSDMKIFPTYKNFLNKYVYQNVPKAQGEWKDIIKEIKAGNNYTLRVYFNPEKKQYIKENLLSTKFYLSSKMDLKKETGEVINGGQYLTSQLSYNFATGISEPLVQIWEDIDNTSATDEYEYWIQVNGSDGIPIPTTEEKNKNNNQTFRMVDVKTYSRDANGKYIAQDDAQINFIFDEENGTWELDGIDDIDGAYYGYNEDENIFHSSTLDADYPYKYYRYKVEGKEGVCYSNEIYSLSGTITLTSKSYSDVWEDRDLMVVVKDLDNTDYFEGGSLKELLGGSAEENWTDVISSVELQDNTTLHITYKDADTEKDVTNVTFYLYGASMEAVNSESRIETRDYLTGFLDFSDTDNKKDFNVTGYQYAREYQIGIADSSEKIPIETTTEGTCMSVNVRLNSDSGSENAQLIFEKQAASEEESNEEETNAEETIKWKLIRIKKENEEIEVDEDEDEDEDSDWNQLKANTTNYQYIIQSLQKPGGDVSTWYSKETYELSSDIVLEEVEYSNVREERKLLIECGNSEGKLSCFKTDQLPEFSSEAPTMFSMRRLSAAALAPTATHTVSPTPTATPTGTPEVTVSPTPMATVVPSALPTGTPDVGAASSPTATSSVQPTGTPDTEVTPSPTPASSAVPTSIPTAEPTPTVAPTPVSNPESTPLPDAAATPNAA